MKVRSVRSTLLFFHRKDHVTLKCKSDELSYETKTLREDCTVAEKKYVACRDPAQAENLASEILCSLIELYCVMIAG